MRMQSMSDIKRSNKDSIENRTTKTKASGCKPQVFGISLNRNINNANPILFNSAKKKDSFAISGKQNRYKYESQRKHKINNSNRNQSNINNNNNDNNNGNSNNNKDTNNNKNKVTKQSNIFEQLNKRISIDYMNTLYSDLGIQYGYELKNKLQNKQLYKQNKQNKYQNKQNILNKRNVNISLPLKQQKQCLNKIKQLIKLKNQINQYYQYMKNTQCLINYINNKSFNYLNINQNINQTNKNNKNNKTNKVNNLNNNLNNKLQIKIKQYNNISDIHQYISYFLIYYQSKQNQLKQLQQQYQSFINQQQKLQQQLQPQQQQQNQEYLNSVIQNLKSQINHQQLLSQKYQQEQLLLINKLYQTQKKNIDLKSSSTNLQIKNTNLKDTIRFSLSNSAHKQPKPILHRSFSLKLQRIKKYNLTENPLLQNQSTIPTKLINRSKSTSSLNSANKNSYLPSIKKQTFIDRIH